MWVAASGGHRMGKEAPWWAKAVVSTLAAAAGGATMGATVGALGGLLDMPLRVALGVAAGALVVVLPLLRVPLPQRNRETPQDLLYRGPYGWSLVNGVLLGSAVTNRIGFWLWYLVPAGSFVTGSAEFGAAIWGAYALTRLVVIDAVALAIVVRPAAVTQLTSRLVVARPRIQPVMTALAVVGGGVFALIVGR